MSFLEYYHSLIEVFNADELLSEIKGSENKIEWPEASGVYVVWRKNINEVKNLIYVGMSGKFKRDKSGKIIFNNGLFKSRATRWTPYRFCETRKDKNWIYTFRYGPKSSKVDEQYRIKYEVDAYNNFISYNDLVIQCFMINKDHQEYTPVLLESLILTKYMKENNNNLPPANNSL